MNTVDTGYMDALIRSISDRMGRVPEPEEVEAFIFADVDEQLRMWNTWDQEKA